jgi:erythromycin esterase
MKQTTVYLVSILLSSFCVAQNQAMKAIPIELDSPFHLTAPRALKEKLSGKKIIAFGEATHGSKEFILMKAGLVGYLHTELGFKDIAIELPQTIGFYLDDYIKGRQSFGYIDSLLRPAKTLYCKEFFSFLRELKTLNIAKQEENKISVYGIDIDQYFEWALQLLKTTISKYAFYDAAQFAQLSVDIPLSHEKAFVDGYEYANANVKAAIDRLAMYLEPLLKETTDPDKKMISICLMQLDETYKYWNTGSISKNAYRDKKMADNTNKIMELFSIPRLFIWAHNGHVRKNDYGQKRLGEYLRETYKDGYYCIGSVFKEGSYRVFYKGKLSQFSLPSSTCGPLAEYLDSFNSAYLFYEVSDMPENIRDDKTEIYDAGIMQATNNPKFSRHKVKPLTDFDAFIYFRKINSLDLIKD